MVTFDAAEPGTPRETWEQDPRFARLPDLEWTDTPGLIVFGAHPDDETLGAGGLIASCASRGIPVQVVCVTDGAASHDGVPDLAATRQVELRRALRILHPGAALHWLGFPDGRAEAHASEISDAIAGIIRQSHPAATIVAPWRGDGHPDHRVVGELAAAHAGDRTVLEYPIWMWHWGSPDHAEVPWGGLASIAIDDQLKRRAIDTFVSQIRAPAGTHRAPLLRPDFLEHFRRPAEYFVASSAAFGVEYFDELYASSEDPWSFRTRWYESRKRAIALASLTRERFRNGLEIGCSVGHLTEVLAERCDALLAIDISERAVAEARRSVPPHVVLSAEDALTGLPDGCFDLVVLSEVAYYWQEEALRDMCAQVSERWSHDGILVACHWRHPVTGHRLSGDRVHEILNEQPWHRVAQHVEEDFILEVFSCDPRSVATREGLV